MNVKRFTAKSSREALALVKQAFGEDAVVLSTKPCPEGIEVLAMAPESMQQIEKLSASSVGQLGRQSAAPRAAPASPAPPARPAGSPQQDADRLSMSTLSFQEYVRNRMLRRREATLRETSRPVHEPRFEEAADSGFAPSGFAPSGFGASRFGDDAPGRAEPGFDRPPPARVQPSAGARADAPRRQLELAEKIALRQALESGAAQRAALAEDARAALAADLRATGVLPSAPAPQPPVLHDEVGGAAPRQAAGRPAVARPAPGRSGPAPVISLADAAAGPAHAAHGPAATAARREQQDMLQELRAMKGLIEERFGALAFMEKLQRQPKQALMTQRLLDCGFSPALIRKMAEGLSPAVADEMAWAAGVLERNLPTAEQEAPLEDQGGVFALVGATGVGKTTSTAKLAAAFATRHGASNLGLITLDAYRVGAHEQLRAYGRILGVPVHTAHDRSSLEDLLELLAGKRMVLIDTAGIAQRDGRAAELLEMLGHASIRKLLVLNAASQGETLEDVMNAYRAGSCAGVVLSKVDEAVKLGPALDALIRNKIKVLAVANGQRVPEDWHRLTAQALVQRALKWQGGGAYRHDAQDVNLIFAMPRPGGTADAMAHGLPPGVPGALAARHAASQAFGGPRS
jgi:flagellar biosynthesis protein FlhF